MVDSGTLLGEHGRYAFAGALKNSLLGERWLGVDVDSGRRVVLAVTEASRLDALEAARGVKQRHLAGIVDVLRRVEPAGVPSGRALRAGFAVAVAEFVPGTTLHAELARSALIPLKAVAWLLRLGEALSSLHAAHAVHGSVSPRSVLSAPEGRAIAPVLTQLVAPALGPFCSPERLKGAAATAQDDVWALHALLYIALTGHAPFGAASRSALLKQMAQGRTKPLEAFGIAQPTLQEIIGRGLAYEKRSRTSELAELMQTLDAWERDPHVRLPRRALPLRAALHSLTDIVAAKGLSKEPPDGIVIDDMSLPADEGAELHPRPPSQATHAPPPAVSSPVASSSPNAASSPIASSYPNAAPFSAAASSEAPSGSPTTPSAPAATQSAGSSQLGDLRVTGQATRSPFRRKRSVWPFVTSAVAVAGGAYYLTSRRAPLAPPAPPVSSLPSRPEPPPPPPAPPKLEPSDARDSCVTSYFDWGAATPSQSFAFLCETGELRDQAKRLRRLVDSRITRPDAGTAHSDAGAAGAALDWYELPATAIIRQACCKGAPPIVLPEPPPNVCESLQVVIRQMAEDSAQAGDLGPDARRFDKAVKCLYANGIPHVYGYEPPPSDTARIAFEQFLSRAALSEARR